VSNFLGAVQFSEFFYYEIFKILATCIANSSPILSALHLAGICQDTKVQAETPPPSPQKAEKGMNNTLFT
jgi:hypothetical protein